MCENPIIRQAERNGIGGRQYQADFCTNEATDGAFCENCWIKFEEAKEFEHSEDYLGD